MMPVTVLISVYCTLSLTLSGRSDFPDLEPVSWGEIHNVDAGGHRVSLGDNDLLNNAAHQLTKRSAWLVAGAHARFGPPKRWR